MPPADRISTGIAGLDTIIDGGLIPNRSYLIRGSPGTGKTMIGLHFLLAGTENGDPEDVLCINLEESTADIERNAESVGLDLSPVEFLDMSPSSDLFRESQNYSIFSPDEVDQESFADEVTAQIEEIEPSRVFIDPITRLRHLVPDEYQFRQQVISFMRFLQNMDTTVMFTSQHMEGASDDDLQFLSDGTFHLENTEHGRTISVPKLRGSDARRGPHSLRIRDDGVDVFPRLTIPEQAADAGLGTVQSGVPAFDELLMGGIDRGTITVISGPTGVGKTTTGAQFMKEAAGRGERSVIYMFEETKKTFFTRAENVNIPVTNMVEHGTLAVEEVEPLNRSAEEFAHEVRREVEENDTKIVMIDGINGYRLSLRGERERLIRKLHSLGRYLKSRGVTVILVEEVGTVTSQFEATDVDISYLSDNIIFLRYIEVDGEMKKVIGVLKKRTSDFERTMREFEISSHGIKVGEPLRNLQGILSGIPTRTDERPAHPDSTLHPGE